MPGIRCLTLSVAIVAALLAEASDVLHIKPEKSQPDSSWVIPAFTAEFVKQSINSRPRQAIEGIWADPHSGAEVAVIAQDMTGMSDLNRATMLVVALNTPFAGLPAGSVVGWITPSARADYYTARMFTAFDDGILYKPKNFFLHYKDGRLGITREQNGVQVNLLGLLPFKLRRILKRVDNTPDNLAGYIRKWPSDPEQPTEVRFL